MGIQLRFLFIILLLLGFGTIQAEPPKKTKYNGNFQTKQIRELWLVCSITFQSQHPALEQAMRWKVCDCYTDVVRETTTPEGLSKLEYSKARELSVKLINECNGKINETAITT